jgi:intracellular sulfur oxidation DsrE/DsrF family protein
MAPAPSAGLAIIVTEAPGPRFAVACELAAVACAMGRRAGMLLKENAVAALADPAVAQALGTLHADGVWIGLCQSAMAAHGIGAADLPAGVEALGLVAFIADHGDCQLLLA